MEKEKPKKVYCKNCSATMCLTCKIFYNVPDIIENKEWFNNQ